ncbi:MAG TPA: Yip1 family protein [Pseudolabrys sp.]|nr:Yip1 family protein [Pseudolabrys sp.]
MNLVERIKGILLQPKMEWAKIESERGDAGYLFSNYVAIVAAIPPICTFIGTSIIGFGSYRLGIGIGLVRAVVVYVLTLVGVFVVGYIIDFLAGTFGARKNLESAMKVSAYAPTAAWLAGVFNLLPVLSFLSILGLYSLYLLYTGIAVLMRPAASNALIYTIAVIVCAIVVWVVILAVPAMLFGMGMMM